MRLVVAMLLAAAALTAPAVATAAQRMQVGFQDDPSFRWRDDAAEQLAAARSAHATIVRTIAKWSVLARRRPAHPASSFDPAYHLENLDALVRNAQQNGLEVMITIWGTPSWANGGNGPNVAPRHASDLRNFAHALADRYSGRHAGYPYVGRYSVWNEPNLGIFLSPQFSRRGKIVSPRIYAQLYRAAHTGLKSGNQHALIAIGETSNRGRDRPSTGAAASVAPATFARLLASQRHLRFDAYATHPYPTRPDLPPTQRVRWPNVTLSQLARFEQSLDAWFRRRHVPVWVTEYGYQTKPAAPHGVTLGRQAHYLSLVLRRLAADPNVHLFVWYTFRDSASAAWKSGLVAAGGAEKPSYRTFASLARRIAGETRRVAPGRMPVVSVAFPAIGAAARSGARVRLAYSVHDLGRLVATGSRELRLRPTQSLRLRLGFRPRAGRTYSVTMVVRDGEGASARTTYALVAT
jgi:cellulase (glycosyl hydrolase family 5)